MNLKPWLPATWIGIVVGLIVALGMTYVDWRHNPQGLFHNEDGTHWRVVIETAISWFVPVGLVAVPCSLLFFHRFHSRRN